MISLLEIFQYHFMLKALLSAVLIALLSGYYGVFVIQRRMAFYGSGLAHSSFGGVGLGLVLGVSTELTSLGVILGVALLITWLKRNTRLQLDTSIGIFFSMSMAAGIILFSMAEPGQVQPSQVLFGNLLAVQNRDLLFAFALVIFSAGCLPYWKIWAYESFDESFALAYGKKVYQDEFFLNILIALVIFVSLKLVGIILVSACLVIPAAAARLISRSFFEFTYKSIILSSVSFLSGLVLSFYFDWPPGAAIVLVQSTALPLCYLFRRN